MAIPSVTDGDTAWGTVGRALIDGVNKFYGADHGFLTWAYDVKVAGSSTVLPTAGVGHLIRLRLPVDGTISSICLRVTTAGTGLANCYAALYDSAGTRRGVTADLSTTWQGAGYYEHPLASAYSGATAGLYYVYLLVGSGTTLPTFTRNSASASVNDGLSVPNLAYSTLGSGLTAAPSTLTLSGQAALNVGYWTGLK